MTVSYTHLDVYKRQALAEVRRTEQHQATMVNWLLSADHSPLETTVAYEQVAIEVTAAAVSYTHLFDVAQC